MKNGKAFNIGIICFSNSNLKNTFIFNFQLSILNF